MPIVPDNAQRVGYDTLSLNEWLSVLEAPSCSLACSRPFGSPFCLRSRQNLILFRWQTVWIGLEKRATFGIFG